MLKYLNGYRDIIDAATDELERLGLASESEDDGEIDDKQGLFATLKEAKNKSKRKKKKKNKPKPEDMFSSNSDEIAHSFEDMNLSQSLLEAIYRQGMEKPSFVQQKGIVPCTSGRDSIIQGQSGMGKTACFVIGTVARLQLLKASEKEKEGEDEGQMPTDRAVMALYGGQPPQGCKVLILVPTRELALQIHEFIQKITCSLGIRSIVCIGGTSTFSDMVELRAGVDIVVGTPGRILCLIERGYLLTEHVKTLILDEADEMLKTRITKKSPRPPTFSFVAMGKFLSFFKSSCTQKILASATISEDMLRVVQPYLNDPFKIIVKNEELTLEGINQYHLALGGAEFKMSTLLDLYEKIQTIPTIIFCSKRKQVDVISAGLKVKEISNYLAVHGEMHQEERERVLNAFRQGQSKILISSDLFGRGIDVQQVQLVINYDFPPSTVQYLHRVGRGGRFGRKGIAISFIANDAEMKQLKEIEQVYETEIYELPIDALKSLS